MKYNFTFSLALLVCFSITLLAQEKDYTITVSLKKFPADGIAYLQYKGLKGEVLDSMAVKDGNFSFIGKIDEPRPASIIIRENGKKAASQHVAKFYIESGTLELVGKPMLFNASISGSPTTAEKKEIDKLLQNNSFAQPEKVRVVSEIVAVPAGSIPPSAIRAGRARQMSGGTVISSRTITNIDELPYEVQSMFRAISEEAKGKIVQFIRDHPSSFVSMYTLNSLWNTKRISYSEYITLINGLSPTVMESNEAKIMFAR